MTDHASTLERLGDALESAAAASLADAPAAGRRRRLSPRVAVLVAAFVILVPGVAFAATQLIGTDEVARSIPAGTLSLVGTEPSCTTVKDGVEYHCTLARAPAPEVSNWKGTVEPTVDATKHVNGGCRSLTEDGRIWECYVGEAAVQQQIVSEGFLGEYAPSPGVG